VPGPIGHLIFAGDQISESIVLLDPSKTTNPVVNASFITGLSGVANIALSNDGRVLYVAQEVAGLISEYNSITGAFIKSVAFAGAHDVVVGKDGSVYATAYGSTSPPSQGVFKFHADLTNGTQFIALNNHGLNHATGMAFDNSGNFWVANAGTIHNGGGTDLVSEYTSAGVYVRQIVNDAANHLLNVFGLTKAVDGNLYAASFGTSTGSTDGSITKINVLTAAVTTFIAAGNGNGQTGLNPKYASSEADCVTYVNTPEPSSLVLLGLGISGAGVSTWFRRRRRTASAG
jgi:sugar lactone lactonase YvrE